MMYTLCGLFNALYCQQFDLTPAKTEDELVWAHFKITSRQLEDDKTNAPWIFEYLEVDFIGDDLPQ
jgi:hypothetical protein